MRHCYEDRQESVNIFVKQIYETPKNFLGFHNRAVLSPGIDSLNTSKNVR